MHSDRTRSAIAVFDLGGTWFRWGCYEPSCGLIQSQRQHAINYLSHPKLSAIELQTALVDFIIRRVQEIRGGATHELRSVSVSVGAPVNAHDRTVLGSGPLWGPTARPLHLLTHLREAFPDLDLHVVNDITALLAPYMDDGNAYHKTMLVTVSSGIGSRLYDHHTHRIPYDPQFGVQGEIGHLVCPFELEGKLINRVCECGGRNHMNAFASGRGIAQTLRMLPSLSSSYSVLFPDSPDSWQDASDEYRLASFQEQIDGANAAATRLLDAFVTPLSRSLATALSLDPDIDRIIITGGVVHGLGKPYREALHRVFLSDGLYQITHHDPYYLVRRVEWIDSDDFSGLRGAGIYATRNQTWN